MARLRIAVIFGGCSEEHPISVKSAREVAENLDPVRYEPLYIGITRCGEWRRCGSPDDDLDDDRLPTVFVSPDRGRPGLLLLDGSRYRTVGVDIVLPVLHGRLGEDGAIQGLLELSGIPYAGCDIQSSALCMDKSLAYIVAGHAGVATPRFRVLTGTGPIDTGDLSYPAFVKPARSGSSFGVSRVDRAEDLDEAVATARRYDPKVLIEEAVAGLEVGCAVLGNGPELITGEVDRIALSHGFFRIHQEDSPELGSENSTPVVPADIAPEERRRVQETAKTVYRALGCRGLARVDHFLRADGQIVLNEVNTLPGLTSYSRYPRMMEAAGLPLSEVLDRVVAAAMTGDQRR
ncbi:MAG TPA: D-alanine--(R)-lactate ligase [Acidimicrobiales bacterium]|nr:D-alanine--(R)-lactate ligase [Acidimicrobiales bacterium]